jgi:hypothetical protein
MESASRISYVSPSGWQASKQQGQGTFCAMHLVLILEIVCVCVFPWSTEKVQDFPLRCN